MGGKKSAVTVVFSPNYVCRPTHHSQEAPQYAVECLYRGAPGSWRGTWFGPGAGIEMEAQDNLMKRLCKMQNLFCLFYAIANRFSVIFWQ